MDYQQGLLLVACIALVLGAGCTGTSPAPAATPAPSPSPAASVSGAGDAACAEDICSYLPSAAATTAAAGSGVSINASPQSYSPLMSSTPGIRLAAEIAGPGAGTAACSWDASYGHFLTWNSPGYTVNETNGKATSCSDAIYWSYTEKPASIADPVVITVTARDPATGTVLGTSALTLAWDDDNAVTVQKTV